MGNEVDGDWKLSTLTYFCYFPMSNNTFVEKLSFPVAAEGMLQVLALAYVMFTLAHKGIMIDKF